MAITTRTNLKSYFQQGDRPTEANFIDLIDSFVHLEEGTLYISGSKTYPSGSTNVQLGMAISGSILPGETNTFDLGTSGKEWRDLYVDRTAHITNLNAGADALNVIGNVTASGDIVTNNISASGNISASSLNTDTISINLTAGSSQDLNSSAIYSVNGSKVEVKAITAANLADGAFAKFELRNTSIAANSIVLGSFTGGTGGLITGSILTAATIGANTASVQIHNETGGNIAADTPFTASFVVL